MSKYVPAHARPVRLPVTATTAATTAGLTLSLVPAMLVGTAGTAGAAAASGTSTTGAAATAAAAAAAPSTPVGTRLMINEMGRVDSAGRTALAARVITKSGRYVAGQQVRFQVFYAKRWVTLTGGTATSSSTGGVRVAVPLKGLNDVRAYFPGNGTFSGSISRTVQRYTLGQRAVLEARKHYGAAYRYGSAGPTTFDCSGFSSYVYRQLGISLPRTSREQQAALRKVAVSDKRVGDLIFTYYGGRVGHVGIYAGNGRMWAATKTGDIVRQQTIYSRSITVGRIG